MKEPFLLQILVVVASIQMRTLKIDVGQGFMRTEVDHELVNPWLHGLLLACRLLPHHSKGSRVHIL